MLKLDSAGNANGRKSVRRSLGGCCPLLKVHLNERTLESSGAEGTDGQKSFYAERTIRAIGSTAGTGPEPARIHHWPRQCGRFKSPGRISCQGSRVRDSSEYRTCCRTEQLDSEEREQDFRPE